MLSNEDIFEIESSPIAGQLGHELLPLDPCLISESKEELERVLNHPSISRSTNLVRFLSFVCTKYFEGEAEEIRERTVAVEALGRKESSFDSHSDPIVRVSARELRKKLGEFYENEGKDHPIQIVLPRGRYIPQFVRRPIGFSAELTAVEPAVTNHELPATFASVTISSELSSSTAIPHTPSKGWQRLPRRALLVSVLIAVFLAGYFMGHRRGLATVMLNAPISWGEPSWSDEFDGPSGHAPEASRWVEENTSHDGSKVAACAASANCIPAKQAAFLNGSGQLVLRASKNRDDSWTTPRLSTRGVKDFQYGRIEARMKLPVGAGLWPAFWLMGSSFPKVNWPETGSVDIMENVGPTDGSGGLGPHAIRSTIHGPGYFGQTAMWHDYRFPNGGRVDDGGFHTYGVIWSPQMMRFYVDDPSNIYFTKQASDLPKGAEWVFDKPFYVVLSLAIGGDWPGRADNMTPNPADIMVDYVRVYSLPPAFQKSQSHSLSWWWR